MGQGILIAGRFLQEHVIQNFAEKGHLELAEREAGRDQHLQLFLVQKLFSLSLVRAIAAAVPSSAWTLNAHSYVPCR
jgi:hypothetical protein